MVEPFKKYVLVTGVTGFIGKALCNVVSDLGFNLRAVVRNPGFKLPLNCQMVSVGDIDAHTDWGNVLTDVDTIIHLAGRVHITNNSVGACSDKFRETNVLGTQRLAVMAAKAKVRRFIFVSSIKVNGEGIGRPYTENDLTFPQDAYARSKKEAEDVLTAIAGETGLELAILRPPLVYGPNVQANFKSLIKAIDSGLPLPFKGLNNQRSFIYVGNLVDAIVSCINHPAAAGQIFMVSDGEDISLSDLLKLMAKIMNKKLRLFFLPPGILRSLFKFIGQANELDKITRSLILDSRKIRDLLNWNPPFTLEEGLRRTLGCGKS